MKRLFLALILAITVACSPQTEKSVILSEDYQDMFNIFFISDSGRNGHYRQKDVAYQMGELCEVISPEFILSGGDTHHYNGVRSVNDPLWSSNFESIYTHPELLIDWYPSTGNHEYKGSIQALIDYSDISRRWNMPSRYYTQTFNEQGVTVQLIVIDTPPLIDKYRVEGAGYSDAPQQDMQAQLEWLESTLQGSTADWVVVMGHHPIYAQSTKSSLERENMQSRVDPILRKYSVDLYLCGHIHSFQHIQMEGSDIEYVVNTSGGRARSVYPIEGTQFCSGDEGFTTLSFDSEKFVMNLVNYDGELLYTYSKRK